MSEPRVSGAEIRVAITGASPLVNPRLSEINWDDVARVLNAQREEVAARTPSQPDRPVDSYPFAEVCPGCGRSDEHAAPCTVRVRLPGHATPSQPDLREAEDLMPHGPIAGEWGPIEVEWFLRVDPPHGRGQGYLLSPADVRRIRLDAIALASQPAPAAPEATE